MRVRQLIFVTILSALSTLPSMSATLSVSVTATPDASLFDYTYIFSVAGAGARIDNIFLGSDDLSPVSVVLRVNGNPTVDWSWLGNDTPQNYLQFFDTSGTSLGNGDALDVTFSSHLASQTSHFAVALDSSTGQTTNMATGLAAPSAAAPEPGSLLLFGSAFAILFIGAAVCRIRRAKIGPA
jgi:hypothetical protein